MTNQRDALNAPVSQSIVVFQLAAKHEIHMVSRALWCVSGVDACPNSEMVRLSPVASARFGRMFSGGANFLSTSSEQYE